MNVKRGEWMTCGAGRRWTTVVVMLLCFAAPSLTTAQKSAHSSAVAQHVPTQHLPPTAYVRPTKCQPVTINISLQQHEMPDVTGCTYDEVVNSFREFGGGMPKREERFSDAPVGQIVEQTPDLKSRLPQDKPIVLTVSKGLNPPPPPAASMTLASSALENLPIEVPLVPRVVVPDVIGSSEVDAKSSIVQSQLRAISRGDEPSLMPRGKVTRTEPQARTPVHSDTDVDYWVASGSNVVPDLSGQSIEQSQMLLARAGFRPGAVTYRSNPGIAGLVLDQDPRAKTIAPLDSSVATTVSRQPVGVTVPSVSASEKPPIEVPPVPRVEVPDVIGSSEADAQSSIVQSQLRAISRGDEPSLMPRGKVTRTEPQARTPVHSDTDVDYWVASGSNVVPDLAGQSVEQSQTLLARAGFRPGVVTYRSSPGIEDLVLDQDPRAKTIAPLDSSVATTVSRQPVGVTVPYVMDMPLKQAVSTLDEAGLASGRVVREFHLSRSGHVFRQDPRPGAIVEQPAAVSMWVSSALASIIALVAGLVVGLAGVAGWLWHMSRRRLIEVTRQMLRIKPSLASDNETRVTLAMPMDGPTTVLRARLEMGEVRFEGPVPIERRETSHD